MSTILDNLSVALIADAAGVNSMSSWIGVIGVVGVVALGGASVLFLRARRVARAEPPAPAPAARSAEVMAAVATFDPVEALQLCANDQGLLQSLLDQLPEEITSQQAVIRAAVAGGDAARAGAAAHRLKGALLIVVAKAGADRALAIEKAGKVGDLAAMSALCAALDEELARVLADIARYNRSPR